MKSNAQPPNHFKVIDVCFQSAGAVSLGCRRYLFLIRKIKDRKKLRLIDMKQAIPPAGADYTAITQPAWATEADRIVSIQKRMQYTSPAQLSPLMYKENTCNLCFDSAADHDCSIFLNAHSEASWIGSDHLGQPYEPASLYKMRIYRYVL